MNALVLGAQVLTAFLGGVVVRLLYDMARMRWPRKGSPADVYRSRRDDFS